MDTIVSGDTWTRIRDFSLCAVLLLCSIVPETVSQESNCTGQSIGGTCFTLFTNAATWSEARQTCASGNGRLAAITNQAAQDILKSWIEQQGQQKVWLGAYHTVGNWRWINDGDKILQQQGCYRDVEFDRDLPVSFNMSEDQMTNEKCMAICQTAGYSFAGTQAGIKCYCGNSYGKHGTKTKTGDCTTQCSGIVSSADTISPYCGGILHNSVLFIEGSYAKWAFNQPNNHDGNQNCGVINKDTESKMEDEECWKEYGYICEIFSGVCPDQKPPYYPYPRDGLCLYFTSNVSTWDNARADCQARDGDLVQILNSNTFNVLKNLTTRTSPIARRVWIGLHKGAGWQWDSGDEFEKTFWETDHPVLPGTCARMDKDVEYKWTEGACAEKLPFICQSGDTNSTGTRAPRPSSTASTPEATSVVVTRSSQSSSSQQTTAETITTTPSPSTSQASSTTSSGVTLVGPSAGQAVGGSGLSDLELALIIVFVILGLLLLAIIIACAVMWRKRKRQKIYSYDARPQAPVPNSGSDPDYDTYSSTEALPKSGPW